MELACRATELAGQPLLQVQGEVDLATLPAFRDHLARLVTAHPGITVFVDLDGTTALDDSGIGMLLGAAGRARMAGGDLEVVCTDPRLLERFTLTRLDRAVVVRRAVPR
ncbi:MAG: STAS domain-containing protein [Ilumatobacteraceae bacterium]